MDATSPRDPLSPPALAVTGLVMRYGEKVAVDGLSLSVRQGVIAAVLGPNGAGKTTTLETCEGYRRPQAGVVRVLGLDPVAERRRLLPRIGVMLQGGGAWSGVRATEMLRHVAGMYTHPLDVGLLVERLGLDSCGRTPYRRLSGGQQQRLGLAMALVGRPELVFVDEPTAGLDPQARRTVWDLLEELRADGVTIVLTTHFMDEAERLADEVFVVDHGRVVAAGSPAALTTAHPAEADQGSLAFRARPGLEIGLLQSALPDVFRVVEDPPGEYAVHGPVGPDTLARVTTWCAQHEVLPQGLHVGRRTLEDVFLELTGRELR
ncbi:MAG TPA: ABC transporter ATP-binding protein [Nocardioidaceae bacterium]|nr:ABC transporter ATP-binding protein [Nocardioidaceae bacterium]